MESGTKPRSVTAKNTVHKRNKKEEPVVDKNTRSSKRHKKTEQPDKSTTSKKRKEEETLPQAENEDDYLSTTHTKKRKQLSDFPISSLSTTTKSKSKKKKNMETKGSDSSTNPPSSDAPKKSSEGFKGGLFGKQSDSFSPNPLGRSRLNTLLQGIKAEGDEGLQLQCLVELSDFLSIGTEENLSNFAVDQFVPALATCLNMEHNAEIMLLSCRALAYIMEALPSSVGSVVSHHLVPILCAKLLNIEYIDLAEQALQCLEKISYEHPAAIVREGGLMAVLTFFDFFATGTQRVALSIAANICRQIPSDCYSMITDAFPILTNLLQYPDQKIVEKAIICFARLAESLFNQESYLQALTKHGLLSNLIRLISNTSGTSISAATYTSVLRLLTTLCYGSPSLAIALLEEGIASILQTLLLGTEHSDSNFTPSTMSTEQLYEILSLINELLPPLPKDFTLFLTSSRVSVLGVSGNHPIYGTLNRISKSTTSDKILRKIVKPKSDTTDASESEEEHDDEQDEEEIEEQEEEEEHEEEETPQQSLIPPPVEPKAAEGKTDPRETILKEKPQLLVNFGECLLQSLFQSFTSTMNTSVKYKCLAAILKIIHFSTADMLRDLLRTLSISSFIANLLSSSDVSIVATALRMSEILISKLPDIFFKYFNREGVVFEIKKLASSKILKKKPSSTEPVTPDKSNSDIEDWIFEHANKLKEHYFTNKKGTNDDDDVSEELKLLKALSAKLLQAVQSFNAAEAQHTLNEISSVLSASTEGISTFEFLSSNLTEALLAYLTNEDSGTEVLLQRVGLFCKTFLNPRTPVTTSSSTVDNNSHTNQPFLALVRKLHQSIAKVEHFPVILHDVSGTAAGLKYLTQPLKLKLQKDEKESRDILDYADNTVLIEPLATIQAIHDFLLTKINNANAKDKNKEKDNKNSSKAKSKVHTRSKSKSDATEEAVKDISPEESSSSNEAVTQLELFLEGEKLPLDLSIFQAIQRAVRKHDKLRDSQPQTIHRLWESSTLITYRVAPNTTSTATSDSQLSHSAVSVLDSLYVMHVRDKLSTAFESAESTHSLLSLLRIFYELNWMWTVFQSEEEQQQLLPTVFSSRRYFISPIEFINNKLTAKLMRQLQDPLTLCTAALPDWCPVLTAHCSFLFPFDCRKLYFYCTSFGIARALQAQQQHSVSSNSRSNDLRIGRIQRQKVRISRSRILDSAKKVMQLYGKSKSILEVEYFNEVGTGLGPTLEFYTLVSRELQRTNLYIWRDPKHPHPPSTTAATDTKAPADNDKEEYVNNPGSLFPLPIQPDADSTDAKRKREELWSFIGTFVAKALLDNRLLDLPLSIPFLKWMLGKPLTFHDLSIIDPELHASLHKLVQLCHLKRQILADHSLSQEEKLAKIRAIKLGNVDIKELYLDFTMPGRPSWLLKPKGDEIEVTMENLEEYVDLVVQQHLVTGVEVQLKAFKSGFDQVFPLSNLAVFMVDELESLLCGTEDSKWDMQTLLDNTRCDHGYSHSSPTVKYLLELMTEFNSEEQRQFLLFVTGSPKLPVGGFKSLEPKLTIVRKDPGSNAPDAYLPSVNCCFYYLKLPEYSDKAVLRDKLKFAIENGQGSFSFN